jgi:hypothetical protein
MFDTFFLEANRERGGWMSYLEFDNGSRTEVAMDHFLPDFPVSGHARLMGMVSCG